MTRIKRLALKGGVGGNFVLRFHAHRLGREPVQQFIAKRNVARYQRLLEQEADPMQKARLERLLAEAKAELERQRAQHATARR